MIAVDCHVVASILQTLIQINNPAYAPQRWHVTLLAIAAVSAVAAFSTLAVGSLSLLEGVFVICHVFGFGT